MEFIAEVKMGGLGNVVFQVVAYEDGHVNFSLTELSGEKFDVNVQTTVSELIRVLKNTVEGLELYETNRVNKIWDVINKKG
jgi:hypothetical protein